VTRFSKLGASKISQTLRSLRSDAGDFGAGNIELLGRGVSAQAGLQSAIFHAFVEKPFTGLRHGLSARLQSLLFVR
jgi:hypothetical protein